MKNKIIKQLVVNAMFIALLVVSSFISIPINHIPYTLQTLLVFIILINLDMKSSIIIFIIYLIMGLIGLPIFSSFTSGITPTFGFIIGFVITPLVYYIFDKLLLIKKDTKKYFIICLICLLVIDVIGCIFYSLYFEISIIESIILSILPYILFDILKIIIAILVSKRIKNIYTKE